MPSLPRATFAAGAALALGLATVAGCTTDSSGDSAALDTRIAIHPAAFLDTVPCSAEPGAMRSYVVTLLAWNGVDDVTPFTVTASYPTSCARTVAFETLVVPGTWYTAEVQGYDVPPEALEPVDGYSSGSSMMLDPETGDPVSPRWTTRCGNSAADGAYAIEYETRYITRCDPLNDASPTPTTIRFAPEQLLGADPCDSVLDWAVYPEDGGLQDATALACDSAPVDYTDGLAPGGYYEFYVTAERGRGAEGALCFAVAREGVTVRPTCNPLTTEGYVDLRPQEVEVDGAPLCPTGGRFDILLDDTALNGDPLACEQPVRIGPLEPGDYALQLVVVDALGVPTSVVATCTATVEPGRAVLPVCSS